MGAPPVGLDWFDLALATPAALTSAASALRGSGVIVRGENALEAGGTDFPRPVKDAMTAVSQVMTRSSYRL